MSVICHLLTDGRSLVSQHAAYCWIYEHLAKRKQDADELQIFWIDFENACMRCYIGYRVGMLKAVECSLSKSEKIWDAISCVRLKVWVNGILQSNAEDNTWYWKREKYLTMSLLQKVLTATKRARKREPKVWKFSMKLANRSSDLNIWPLTDFETAMAVILERRVEITTRRLMGKFTV